MNEIKYERMIFKITTRSDGRSQITIPKSQSLDNKRHSIYATSETELKRKLKQYFTDKQNNQLGTDKSYFDVSIKYWLYNVKQVTLKPSSMDRLESTICTHIIPKIGHYYVKDVMSETIEQLIIAPLLQSNVSHSTIKKVYDALNGFYKFYNSRYNQTYNPMTTIALPNANTMKTRTVRFLNNEEIDKFKSACMQQYANGEYLYSYGYGFIFLIYTGLRPGEAINLRWNDIDFDKKFLYVKGNRIRVKNRTEDSGSYTTIEQSTAKTSAGTLRQIPLNTNAIDALNKLKAVYKQRYGHVPTNFVFSQSNDDPISYSTMMKSYKKIIIRADIDDKGCGVHTLRHTCASLMFNKGIDIKIISEILGHANVSVTYNTYVHLVKQQKVQAMQAIDF